MAETCPAEPVQLFVGVLARSEFLLPEVRERLVESFGPTDLESSSFPFDVTSYYEAEMGPGLRRWFLSFETLISPDDIVQAKLTTNRIEHELREGDRRRINLDPGYMDIYKIVLASAKFQGPKVHLGKGIYADLTRYYNKGWRSYPWGFADFKDGRYDEILTEIRRLYKKKRRMGEGALRHSLPPL
ncbi:MAG: DUF4416 family protein [Candidatus Eisenbacteria sp.]|nr:DUF4416 family protein [Candidatus Eisenbacteria bacterium]